VIYFTRQAALGRSLDRAVGTTLDGIILAWLLTKKHVPHKTAQQQGEISETETDSIAWQIHFGKIEQLLKNFKLTDVH
jgi:hypothetical protein